MVTNPLQRAINSARRANDVIGELFARLGTEAHPRGVVASSYRQARRAMETALKEQNPQIAALEVTRKLREELQSGLSTIYNNAIGNGIDEAGRQLSYYGMTATPTLDYLKLSTLDANLSATLAKVDAQTSAVMALILIGSTDQILGGEDRSGVLSYAVIATAAASAVSALFMYGFASSVYDVIASRRVNFQKQAIAALDSRTTDCCLRVHGQIQDWSKPFKLTGTPRYADEMQWPGFHWWCRTAGVLYLPEFDDGITTKLRNSANTIMAEKAAGGTGERRPASALT